MTRNKMIVFAETFIIMRVSGRNFINGYPVATTLQLLFSHVLMAATLSNYGSEGPLFILPTELLELYVCVEIYIYIRTLCSVFTVGGAILLFSVVAFRS